MKKNIKIIVILFIGILIGMSISSNSFSEKGIYAIKSKFKILVNSEPVNIETYDINGEPYVSLSNLNYHAAKLPIDTDFDYKNKICNIIPSTYIAFKNLDGKKYVDLDYYFSRYSETHPIEPSTGNYPHLSAPPNEKYNYLYFFNLKEKLNSKISEGCILYIKNNKNEQIYKGNVKCYELHTDLRLIMDYNEFIKNVNLFINMIYENEKMEDNK